MLFQSKGSDTSSSCAHSSQYAAARRSWSRNIAFSGDAFPFFVMLYDPVHTAYGWMATLLRQLRDRFHPCSSRTPKLVMHTRHRRFESFLCPMHLTPTMSKGLPRPAPPSEVLTSSQPACQRCLRADWGPPGLVSIPCALTAVARTASSTHNTSLIGYREFQVPSRLLLSMPKWKVHHG